MGFWDETTPLDPDNLNRATVPVGGIIMYSGDVQTLPSGWNLCDGTSGTPDLRDRFIVGAEGSYAQGDTGGADSVTLTAAQIPSHTHSSGSLSTSSTGSHTHGSGSLSTGSAGSHTHSLRSNGTVRTVSGSGLSVSFQNRYGPQTSGAVSSTGVFSSGSHSHNISGSTASNGSHSHSISGNTGSTGGGSAHENRPPFYALALIMRTT